MHGLYVRAGLKFISKLLSPKTAEKYEKFKKKIEKIGNSYLNILIIINVIFIFVNLFLLIYANIELSQNIDAYIKVHLSMKEGGIMLLLVKSHHILNKKNKMVKFKKFNAWSILKFKNKKGFGNMDGID